MAEMEKDLEKGTAEEVKAEAEAAEEVVEEILEECEECAEEETEVSEDAESTEEGSKGPSKWLKKNNKDKEKIAELEDRVMRQMAEFENFRRRTDKEKQAMFETGAKSVIEKMLPVIDNFERGLSTVPEAERESGFASGMNMIYKQLLTELAGIGVKPIEALNQPFDPNFHNAVMHVEDEEIEESTVVEEFQKGYIYKENVIRYSMVKVAN